MQTFPSHHSLRHLLACHAAARGPWVLALVVATRGSSYRKAGALALLDADELRSGCISGGCLEADLLVAAQQALRDGANRHLRLDTRTDDDRFFGSQSGCRGEVDLLLVPSAADGKHALLDLLQRADAEHKSLALAVDLHACPPRWRATKTLAIAHADTIALEIAPTPRVLLLGGGPEAPPLIELAQTCGWWLEVVEHRARYLAQGRLAGADRVHCARPAEALATLACNGFDAVICASHLYDEDLRCLERLSASQVPLIGVLGPRARADELLGELPPAAALLLVGRVHAPIGIALGAYGPEAVALSVAARLTEAFARG
jgi:xanthine dehydrogenase accessory factor